MKRLAILAFLVSAVMALVLPAGAAARPFGPLEKTYYRAALIYWGYGEPPNCSTLDREISPAAELDGNWGHATQPMATIRFRETCTLRIAEEALVGGYGCQVMTHEIGHLLGIEHTSNSSSVMYGGPFHATPGFGCPQVDYQTVLRWEQLTRVRRACPTFLERGRAWRRCWGKARHLYVALRY